MKAKQIVDIIEEYIKKLKKVIISYSADEMEIELGVWINNVFEEEGSITLFINDEEFEDIIRIETCLIKDIDILHVEDECCLNIIFENGNRMNII